MADSRNVLSHRLGAALATYYPLSGRDKLLARDIDVTPRTARNYFTGQFWPGARQWRSIARHLGKDIVDAVFNPEIDARNAAKLAEIRRLEKLLETARAGLGPMAGDPPRVDEAA